MIIIRKRPTEHPPMSNRQNSDPLVATCCLCGENVPLSREEEPMYFGYPRRPYVCPLCRLLVEQSDRAIETKAGARDLKDDPAVNHYATNEMEEKNDDRYDEKFDPDEASDDEHEELRRLLETAGQGGGSKGCGNGCLQAETDGPHLILDIVLIRAMIPLK